MVCLTIYTAVDLKYGASLSIDFIFFHDDLLTWTAHSSITPWLKKTTTKNRHFIWLHMTVTNWLKLICAAILPKLIVIVINQSNFKRFALMGWLSGVQNFGYLSSIHLINPPLFDCLFLFDPDYSIVNFIFFSLHNTNAYKWLMNCIQCWIHIKGEHVLSILFWNNLNRTLLKITIWFLEINWSSNQEKVIEQLLLVESPFRIRFESSLILVALDGFSSFYTK